MSTNADLGKLWDTERERALGISGAWTAPEEPQEVRINIRSSNSISGKLRVSI